MANFDLPPPPPSPNRGVYRWLIGCGIAGVLLVLGCGVCGGLFFASIFSLIKSSTPYEMALAEVQRDPQVIEWLGEPIEASWWATGNLEIHNHDGRADLDFKVTGPRGSADVHTLAVMSEGKWKLTKLLVTAGDREPREIIAPAKPLQPEKVD